MYSVTTWKTFFPNTSSPNHVVTKTFSSPTEISFITSFPQPLARYQLDSSPLLSSTNHIHIPLATYCVVYTLKMATMVFAKMLENLQHLTWLIPESQSCTSR
jgi:hypothetical protein